MVEGIGIKFLKGLWSGITNRILLSHGTTNWAEGSTNYNCNDVELREVVIYLRSPDDFSTYRE